MTLDPDLKTRRLTGDLGKRAFGQMLIVGFLILAIAGAAGIQHHADRVDQRNRALEQGVAASCEILGVPPGDACRAEIRRLREADLLRQGAALTRPDPVAATVQPPRPRMEARPHADDQTERARIRRCLRDINRVLDRKASRAASCRGL